MSERVLYLRLADDEFSTPEMRLDVEPTFENIQSVLETMHNALDYARREAAKA